MGKFSRLKNWSCLLVLLMIAGMLCSCEKIFSDYSISNADPAAHVTGPADQVELVYFHRERRCEACTYAEERLLYLVKTYFADELASGKLVFQIYNLGDKNSQAPAQRYNAIGSQLFINVIIDGEDHIRYVEEIWYWGCIDDEKVFDKVIKNIITKGLYGTTLQE